MENAKFKNFLENAKLLNGRFRIVPLLYGSLGLEQITEANLHSNDINILIPEEFLGDNWLPFIEFLEEQGYTLVDENSHTFIKEDIEYSYDVTLNLYKEDTSKIVRVNPTTVYDTLGMGTGGVSSMYSSMMSSNDVFFEMINNDIIQITDSSFVYNATKNQYGMTLFTDAGETRRLFNALRHAFIDSLERIIQDYNRMFGHLVHPFTGINMVDFYRELIKSENCKVEFVFSNDPKTILKYTKNVLTCDIHTRYRTKRILAEAGAEVIYGLYEVMNEPINNSGFNPDYGLLGSNKSTEERLKLFPKTGDKLVVDIQNKLKEPNANFNDIKSAITSDLFPFIYDVTGRKPIILPIILDIKKDNK